MDYEINVAEPAEIWTDTTGEKHQVYRHLCRVIVSYDKLREVYNTLCAAFPTCKVDVYRKSTATIHVDMEGGED